VIRAVGAAHTLGGNPGTNGSWRNATGSDATGSDETGSDETGSDETGSDETGSDETGGDETGGDETGRAERAGRVCPRCGRVGGAPSELVRASRWQMAEHPWATGDHDQVA
jgi:hypothetical protein